MTLPGWKPEFNLSGPVTGDKALLVSPDLSILDKIMENGKTSFKSALLVADRISA